MTIIRPVLRIDRELDVRPAGLDADLAEDGERGVAHPLIFLVRKRLRRGDGDAVAGVDAHRVEVLDRADDHGVVRAVAHHLHLVLFPADDALLDRGPSAPGESSIAVGDHAVELLAVVGDAAARAAQREAGPQDAGQADLVADRAGLVEVVGQSAAGALQADLLHAAS